MLIYFYLIRNKVVLVPKSAGKQVLFQPAGGSLQNAFGRAGLVLDANRLNDFSHTAEYLLNPQDIALVEKIADNKKIPLTWAKRTTKDLSFSKKAGLVGTAALTAAAITYFATRKTPRKKENETGITRVGSLIDESQGMLSKGGDVLEVLDADDNQGIEHGDFGSTRTMENLKSPTNHPPDQEETSVDDFNFVNSMKNIGLVSAFKKEGTNAKKEVRMNMDKNATSIFTKNPQLNRQWKEKKSKLKEYSTASRVQYEW